MADYRKTLPLNRIYPDKKLSEEYGYCNKSNYVNSAVSFKIYDLVLPIPDIAFENALFPGWKHFVHIRRQDYV